MTRALYRKWRPQNWDEVAAQPHVIQTLRNAVKNDRVAHAYLFSGPRGTGKTTCARLLAKAVNCLDPDMANRPCNHCEYCQLLNNGRFMDLIEIDAASNTSVDDVRDLRDKINFSPSQGVYKVYIIDEVHMLSTAAFNALLKTLEEPPPHAIFILATTEIHKIPATVLSRCQRHEFRRIPLETIVGHLKNKCQDENIRVEDAVLLEIGRQATGSLRDAISLLDQLTSTDQEITLKMAQDVLGTATSKNVTEIINALINNNSAGGLTNINQALDSGTDPRQLTRQIVTYLRNTLLIKMDCGDQVKVTDELRADLDDHASRFKIKQLIQSIEAFNHAVGQEQANWQPGLGLELAFTSCLKGNETDSQESKYAQDIETIAPARQVTLPPEKSTGNHHEKPESQGQKALKQKPVNHENIDQKKKQNLQINSVHDAAHDPQERSSITSDDFSLNTIHENWQKIKSMVGKHSRRTEGLLNSCKLTGLKNDILILGFASQMLKDMMDNEGNINLTMDILEEVTGKALIIKSIVTSNQSNPLPDNLEIDQDGMVSTATRDLGGKISSAEQAGSEE